jgi:hypothetical protein
MDWLRTLRGTPLTAALVFSLLAGWPHDGSAGPREQAKRMHDRLVGVPPSEAVLASMQSSIEVDLDPVAAAYTAMQNPVFYTSALKNFATPWTNVPQTVFADLNDYSATVIGMIRDDVPFDQVLSGDIVYVGGAGVVGTGYSQTDNLHYQQLEQSRADLSDPLVLVRRLQSTLPGSVLAAEDTAGVLTTRAAGEAFFSAGTNRRMWRFTAMNYLCRDMEQLNDITRPADRIRQDIGRSPGGDSRIFHNTCVGCHSGMDPLAGAFAYYEWDEAQARVVFTRGSVQPKYLINANTFPGGYVTVDDSWLNLWRVGPNSSLGWRAVAGAGNGPKTLGMEVAASRAFSECQVEKVFRRVCLRAPASAADRLAVQNMANAFDTGNRSMKRVFAETAAYCMGN